MLCFLIFSSWFCFDIFSCIDWIISCLSVVDLIDYFNLLLFSYCYLEFFFFLIIWHMFVLSWCILFQCNRFGFHIDFQALWCLIFESSVEFDRVFSIVVVWWCWQLLTFSKFFLLVFVSVFWFWVYDIWPKCFDARQFYLIYVRVVCFILWGLCYSNIFTLCNSSRVCFFISSMK